MIAFQTKLSPRKSNLLTSEFPKIVLTQKKNVCLAILNKNLFKWRVTPPCMSCPYEGCRGDGEKQHFPCVTDHQQ